MAKKIERSESEWRDALTPEEFRVLREKGTERAFAGKYWDCKDSGVYHCAACGEPLYRSSAKFDSGTGWPSFWEPVAPDSIATESDMSLGMVRTEAMCGRCGSHLGHVFDDGPAPTGQRHCINSVSLNLKGEK